MKSMVRLGRKKVKPYLFQLGKFLTIRIRNSLTEQMIVFKLHTSRVFPDENSPFRKLCHPCDKGYHFKYQL